MKTTVISFLTLAGLGTALLFAAPRASHAGQVHVDVHFGVPAVVVPAAVVYRPIAVYHTPDIDPRWQRHHHNHHYNHHRHQRQHYNRHHNHHNQWQHHNSHGHRPHAQGPIRGEAPKYNRIEAERHRARR